ncbi:MAG: competence/damage-inducible protein A [Clostridiales bacterium]|jgi:nicotinamide-nucleotide amidase|nr:competence/damage-inducible protein A [Clostridiales bacterium]
MKAEIISIGTELLLGHILNTNAQFLSQQLSILGIDLYFQTSVGDNRERLMQALDIAFNRADIVITTGGLGPTDDDLTRQTIADFFNINLSLHNESLGQIKDYLKKRNRPFTPNNYSQAMFPEEALILPNDNGTAPGFMLKRDKHLFISFPGPPNELKPMFLNHVKDKLMGLSNEIIYSWLVKTYGVGESQLEEILKDLFTSQSNPTLASLVAGGYVNIRITAKAMNEQDAYSLMEPMLKTIKSRLGDAVFGYNDDSLESVVVSLLKEKGYRLAVAESCTGGKVSDLITKVAGASEVFMEGLVTYSNEAKIKRLKVKEETIKQFGAVSQQTAMEMAEGVRRELDTDIGISTTGIAGPGGGSKEKPVGLVYLAIASRERQMVKRAYFTGNRSSIKHSASNELLNLLRLHLIKR